MIKKSNIISIKIVENRRKMWPYESTSYSAMFDDDSLLQQKHWYHLLSSKVKIDNWKELDNNNIKIHVNKSKEELLDQLEKEKCTKK